MSCELKAAPSVCECVVVLLSILGRGWRGSSQRDEKCNRAGSSLPCKVRWPIWAGYRLLATAASPVLAPMTPSIQNLYKLTAHSSSITALHMDPGEVAVSLVLGGLFFVFIKVITTANWQLNPFVFCRLETLQQIANRVQRDCVNGEDKLALAGTALQSVSFCAICVWLNIICDKIFFILTFESLIFPSAKDISFQFWNICIFVYI